MLNDLPGAEPSEYLCHTYVRKDNLCGVLISDDEYPERVAQTLLGKALDDFSAEYPPNKWAQLPAGSATCKKIDEYLQRYMNPVEADGLMRLHAELDETKIILHNTLESLLARGEKLDDLVDRSEELGMQSKLFYTTVELKETSEQSAATADDRPVSPCDSGPGLGHTRTKSAKKTNKCCVLL